MTADTLRSLLDAQRAAFASGAPDYQCRMSALARLRDGVQARRTELVRAISDDFGGRSREEKLMLELLPFYDEIRHVRRHLEDWMHREQVGSTWFLKPSHAFVQYQP